MLAVIFATSVVVPSRIEPPVLVMNTAPPTTVPKVTLPLPLKVTVLAPPKTCAAAAIVSAPPAAVMAPPLLSVSVPFRAKLPVEVRLITPAAVMLPMVIAPTFFRVTAFALPVIAPVTAVFRSPVPLAPTSPAAFRLSTVAETFADSALVPSKMEPVVLVMATAPPTTVASAMLPAPVRLSELAPAWICAASAMVMPPPAFSVVAPLSVSVPFSNSPAVEVTFITPVVFISPIVVTPVFFSHRPRVSPEIAPVALVLRLPTLDAPTLPALAVIARVVAAILNWAEGLELRIEPVVLVRLTVVPVIWLTLIEPATLSSTAPVEVMAA